MLDKERMRPGDLLGRGSVLQVSFSTVRLRPMSHLRFYRAILPHSFIARQNCKCDMVCHATSQQSRNSFSD